MTRLDRDTFGVVLLAKNAHVHNLLQQVPMQKIYHALTFGGRKQKRESLTPPLPGGPCLVCCGKFALTESPR